VTPRELAREISAAIRRHANEHNARAWLAWHVAALQRSKKMPPLKRLMAQEKRRRQTWQEQLKMVELWQAVLGGEKK